MTAAIKNRTPACAAAVPVVELAGVGRSFKVAGEVLWALQPLELRIVAGEFVAIMGTSGSGKSTLLNLLGLLDSPSTGAYHLLGRNTAALNEDERAALRGSLLGFVFQSFHLLPRTSAVDNVALPLLYQGSPQKGRRQRARAALARVGLSQREEHVPAQLSGGQQQRVAIARALVGEPKLLLADEPTGNLDSKTSLEVMAMLQALNDAGLTTLLVTHEKDIALCAKRILHFRDGHLVSDEQVGAGERRMLGEAPAAAPAPIAHGAEPTDSAKPTLGVEP